MNRTLILVVLLPLLAPGSSPRPSSPMAGQSEVAGQTLEETAIGAVRDFYRDYWQAWQTADPEALEELLSDDFVLLSYVPGQGPVQVGKAAAMQSARRFFAAAAGQQLAWQHSLLTILLRGDSEAIVVVRTEVAWPGEDAQVEISLEVVRRGPGGHWQLVRRSVERILS